MAFFRGEEGSVNFKNSSGTTEAVVSTTGWTLDTTKDTASRLMSEIEPSGGIGDLLNDEEAEVSADFYV